MDYKVKVQLPLMPNFISIETLQDDYKISVCELTNEQAIEYGELIKQTFIQHHKECVMREEKKPHIEKIIIKQVWEKQEHLDKKNK